MQQYFAEYGFDPPIWSTTARSSSPAATRARAAPPRRSHAGFAWPRGRASRSSPRPSSTPSVVRAAASATRRAARTSTRCCATCPRCASATRSCTRSTASAATSGSSRSTSATAPDRVPAARCTPNGAKLYVPVSQLHLISRYSGARAEDGAAARARQRPVGEGEAQGRRSRCATPPPSCSTSTRSAPRARATRSRSTPHDYEAFADGFRFEETPDQQRRDRRGHRTTCVAAQPMDRAGLRRRRLRQDRSRAARRVRRRRRRQAGRGARADHAARRAALPDVLATASPTGRCKIAELSRFRSPQGSRRPRSKASPTARVDIVIGTHKLLQPDVKFKNLGPRHHRRGAPLRRAPEGAAEDAARRSRRADADRDADPAHARHGARRAARFLGDRDRAAAAPRDQDFVAP